MPQIIVEYSAALADVFDRRGFALAVHAQAPAMLGNDGYKTRFRPLDDVVIGDGAAENAMAHVEMGILSGRDAETRKRLSALVLDLLGEHLRPPAHLRVQLTVEIREMDRDTYGKRVT
ncbi:5-carboxymethyl-2-hydroxymuconate Delta-isomerase [Bailinhaonella thermotolerans]|uniref:Isomerase n=1 Tax=Bailinhaonella thermotolerans TaxID=1070861 RepID=A0A3A4ALI4_9ACTN|nr:isomerase [Bailinhaonella thermotolerans]RJL26520.1 isomerase [Bailinhaonella thermotolerans]